MSSIESLATDVKYIRDSLDDLKQYTIAEFIEVKNRQDHTNGSVSDLQIDKIRRDEQMRIVKWGLSIVAIGISAVTTAWAIFFFGPK